MKLLRSFSKVVDSTNEWIGSLVSWLSLFLVLLTCQQVIARYFFDESSIALQELEWHLFGALFLLAAAKGVKDNTHVRVDILYSKRSERTQNWIDLLGTLIFLIPATVIIIIYGIHYTEQALQFTNPHPADYLSSSWFSKDSIMYSMSSTIEGVFRKYIIVGEISPDPGGLEARWIIKAAIPVAFILVLFQALSQAAKNIITISTGSGASIER